MTSTSTPTAGDPAPAASSSLPATPLQPLDPSPASPRPAPRIPFTRNTPPPTRLTTWFGVWARLAGIGTFIVGSIAVFMVLHVPGDTGRGLATAAMIAQVAVVVVALPLSYFAGGSLRRLQRLLDQGVHAEALPPHDVIVALRLPFRVFWIVWSVHLAFAVVFVFVAINVDVLTHTIRDVVPCSISMGFISAATQAYVMAAVVRTDVTPLLVPRGRLEHLADANGQVPHIWVWQHLAMMVTALGIAWPVTLYTFFRVPTEADGVAQYVLLAVLFALLAGHQVVGLIRVVAGGVGHLKARMEEVRNGDFNVEARVFGLDTFGVLASDFNRMTEGLRQREHLKETFGRYVTQQVVDEILAGRVALGGELKTATVLFSDIRGFTRMSEKLTPQEVVAFLNEYLAAMVDCVIEHGGVLDKFIGDAVMAVFGVPVGKGSAKDDAVAAVACAVAMGKKLDEMNARRRERGLDAIAIGIGVHTGELVAGNIGSPRRMQYTVIGDTVNVGSRLESLTKEHARRTLLSEATARLVEDRFPVVEVGRVPVRGRDETLLIFGLEGEPALVTKSH